MAISVLFLKNRMNTGFAASEKRKRTTVLLLKYHMWYFVKIKYTINSKRPRAHSKICTRSLLFIKRFKTIST